MFFEIWVLWGDAGFFALCVWVPWGDAGFALFASGCLRWLLLGGWFWLLQGPFWCPRDYILSPLCRSGVTLRPEESVISKSCQKIRKSRRLVSSIGSFLGHILRRLPPKVESTSVLLHSFVGLFSGVVFAAFRSGLSEESVESRRRPMCV